MENNIFYILLFSVALVVFVFFKVRNNKGINNQDIPEFDELDEDDILDEDIQHLAEHSGDIIDPRIGDSVKELFGKTSAKDLCGELADKQEEIQPFVGEKKQVVSEYSKSNIILYVLAQPGRDFLGYELLQALLSSGLRYGEMSIFHRHENTTGTGKILFSLASATEPGVFDMDKIGAFATTGLCLFMRVTGEENEPDVLELMFKTANQLADDLGGAVKDEKRNMLTDMAMNKCREIVYSFADEQSLT